MSTIRHPIYREPASNFGTIDLVDPFRDSGWRQPEGILRGPFRDSGWRDISPVRVHRGDPFHEWPLTTRDHFYRDNGHRDYYSSGRDAGALVPATASSGPVTGALPLSRSFFNPERQLSLMDGEMSRMASEMQRMFSNMQHLMPADADPDSWRVKENFLLENPFVHDSDGNKVFRLKFDVRQFRPEEIFVKTMGNELVVHAKHEEKSKDKSLHREYKRLYILPKELSPDNLVSKLTRDGVLSIEAKLPPKDGQRDRLIPIKHE